MGKAEVGTPKYLANKMKAKGLQKLRWYCQMCQKQCRDENGFKCHTMSESHQRQLLLFADNSGKYIHSFSKEFSDGYLEVLRRRFGTKRVAANKVYQEYISDKNHLHMNATKWLTLTDYVKWLGRIGQCVVDETEKGWFVTYIDRSPEAMEAQEKVARKEKMDKDDQERMMEFIEKQIQRNKKSESENETEELPKPLELIRTEDKPIKLDITLKKQPKPESILQPSKALLKRGLPETSNNKDEYEEMPEKKIRKSFKEKSEKKSALDEIIKIEEEQKERKNRTDYWLAENIVVKFVGKSLGEKFYNQKGVILKVIDRYVGKMKFFEGGEKVKIDQAHVETVIPALGKPVLVVNGAYRGYEAIMKAIDEDNFCATLEILKGPLKGRVIKGVQYEDFSKINLE